MRTYIAKMILKIYQLDSDWNMICENDGCEDIVSLTKENVKIVFREDLREHIINFEIISPKSTLKVYYRQLSFHGYYAGVENLKEKLHCLDGKNNVEEDELNIYYDFLKKNDLI